MISATVGEVAPAGDGAPAGGWLDAGVRADGAGAAPGTVLPDATEAVSDGLATGVDAPQPTLARARTMGMTRYRIREIMSGDTVPTRCRMTADSQTLSVAAAEWTFASAAGGRFE